MGSKHRPQRSCVICRAKRDKRMLTRLVFEQGKLRVDETGKINGRGAYLCADASCWRQAVARPILNRALRQDLSQDDRDYLRQMTPS